MSDVMNIPKYIATPIFDEESVRYFGEGNAPEEALEEFNSVIVDYAEIYDISEGEDIEVHVFTTVAAIDSDRIEEAIAEGFTWFLDKPVRTVVIKYKK